MESKHLIGLENISKNDINEFIENGFLFKITVALIDTRIIYGVIYLLKGKIDIANYDEE